MGLHSKEIDRTASEWVARLGTGALSPEEQACLDAWCAADPRHLGAFARAQAILVRVSRLRAVGADALRSSITDAAIASPNDVANEFHAAAPEPATVQLPAVVPAAENLRSLWTHRRALLGGGAAALAAAGIAAVVLVSNPQQEFATAMGETRTMDLPDGSVITLNTNSRVFVTYTDEVRKIRLSQGEAIFKVAKNKARPFVVVADDTEVRAVGTAFTVRLLPERPVQILVQEGVVEVVRRDSPVAIPIRAVAETKTVVPSSAPIVVQPLPHPQVARQLAWQYGRIALENETLADAAQEFARYSDTRIIVDPSVAGHTITGLFASNDPVGFAKVAAAVLDLRVEEGPKEVHIYR